MDGPENYKSPELLSDLALKVQDYMFLSTGDVKYRSNPLIGAPDSMVRGEVRELTSLETGIIGLQTGETVLFHLDQVIKINIIFERFVSLDLFLQVWTHSGERVLYKTVQDTLLETYLPFGSKVWVNYRSICADHTSSLKNQATIVVKNVEESNHMIPQEYIDKFKPFEIRLALVDELDKSFDAFKKVMKQHKHLTNNGLVPVHAVLNGLPEGWGAEIVASLDDQFGIIKISNVTRDNLAPGVNLLYAMFHIEDVYDMAGLPAFLNPNISMSQLMNCHVNLTARSICKEYSPKNIFSVQRSLLQEERGAVPLLQAVVVCLKVTSTSSVNTSTIPKPSVIRESPKSFGDLGCQHYLNPILFAKLDIKLKAFLNIPNKMDLPYKSILKNVTYGKTQEKSMIQDLKQLDTNNSAQFIYGRPPDLGAPSDLVLPRILTSQPVTPVYLHRTRFRTEAGLLQLELELEGRAVKTWAYFELARSVY